MPVRTFTLISRTTSSTSTGGTVTFQLGSNGIVVPALNSISPSTATQSLTPLYLLRVSGDGLHVDQVDPTTIGGVSSVNGHTGAVSLTYADVGADQAGAATSATNSLAAFVATTYAPIANAHLTGTPTAPTPAPGNNTTQLATTQYVVNALSGIGSAVISVAGRTGAVVLAAGDIASGVFADARLSTNVALYGFAGTFTSPQIFGATSGVQAVVKAFAGQTTTNLQEWQNSAGAAHLFVSPNKVVSTYDNYYFAIKPGTREYQFGTYDAAGMFLFGRSDSANALQFTPNSANIKLNCTSGDMLITASAAGKLYLAGNESGGAVNIEMGCRYSDSSPSVGANVRIWTATGQAVPALSILIPGGSTVLGGFNPSGRLIANSTDSAPTNTTTIVGWLNVIAGSTTYKMPLYQ